jgi:hypothetical protein
VLFAEKAAAPQPWPQNGWEPLLFAKTYARAESIAVTGDLSNKFVELVTLDVRDIDRDGPQFISQAVHAPGIYEIAFLKSDHWRTQAAGGFAVSKKLLPLGSEIVMSAFRRDPEALLKVGQFLLYELGDLEEAVVYLNHAVSLGNRGAFFDLIVAAMFSRNQ